MGEVEAKDFCTDPWPKKICVYVETNQGKEDMRICGWQINVFLY